MILIVTGLDYEAKEAMVAAIVVYGVVGLQIGSKAVICFDKELGGVMVLTSIK